AQFDGDDIALRHDAGLVRAQDQSLPSPVPDDEQVLAGFDGPAQTCICAHILRFSVVLNEAAEHQIGAPGVGTLQLPQTLDEVALRKAPEIILDIGFQLHSAFRRRPLQIVLPLRQVAIVERAEPCGISKLQRSVTAGLRFETVTSELVRAWRKDDSGSDCKRSQQDLAMRVPVELEAIAGLEPDIDRCHEIFPGFEYALRVGIADALVFKELLANPAEGAVLGWARLVGAKGIGATRARLRKKSKQRLERDAELIHASIAIQQIVRVVGTESPTDLRSGLEELMKGRGIGAAVRLRFSLEFFDDLHLLEINYTDGVVVCVRGVELFKFRHIFNAFGTRCIGYDHND